MGLAYKKKSAPVSRSLGPFKPDPRQAGERGLYGEIRGDTNPEPSDLEVPPPQPSYGGGGGTFKSEDSGFESRVQ